MSAILNIFYLLCCAAAVGSDLPASRSGILPHIKFEPFLLPSPAPFEGRLAPNGRLDRAELVWSGAFEGAESIVYRGDEAYTGVIGGYIIRINHNGTWEKIVQTGTPCAGPWEMTICGRPLGLRFAPDGKLIVADYTKGLLRVDVDARTVQTLIPRFASIGFGNDNPLNVVDDIDVDKEGIIYFSDIGQNTVYGGDFLIDGIGDPTGRLIRYNPWTQQTEVLLRGLRFANGVQLSRNQDFVAVNEMGMGRTWKVYLTGNKMGQFELLVENLPGTPDNIRSNGKGGFYIAVVTTRYSASDVFGQIAIFWWIRKLLVIFQRKIVNLFQLLYSIVPSQVVGSLLYYAMHFGPVGDYNSFPRHGVVVEIDENGNILGSLQNHRSGVAYVTQLDPAIDQEYSYIGTPSWQLWRIRTEHLF